MAKKIPWNKGWEFCELQLTEQSLEMPRAASFAKTEIPHDWMIYNTHALYRDSVGWYRKEFELEEIPQDCVIRFDGVYMDTTVFVNGKEAGEWKYGYSTFEVPATPFLKKGKNEVYVRVVYRFMNSRWYSGAGIYRNVWWKERKRSHIISDGIYVTPVKESDICWRVEIDTQVAVSAGETGFVVKQILFDKDGKQVAADVQEAGNRRKADEEQAVNNPSQSMVFTVSQQINSITHPRLWDIGKGNLYLLRTELWKDGELWESEEQHIGFRTMEFVPDKGFLLNGRKVKINGACEHHDFGCLGAAFSEAACRRKFVKLRQMGVNAIRTSHNMPAPELMNLADEMGFLVVSEAFDMWEKEKTPYDYGRFFNDWYERDVQSWVMRDRNHACLMMWSIGNEIQDTLAVERGTEITKNLCDAVRKYDYKKNAPVTIGSNFMKWEGPKKCAELLDCVGYNYSEYLYDNHHKEHPKWIIYGSETSSVLASRGIYHFPLAKSVLTDEDEQCSALGNSVTGWGADSYEACICDDRDTDYSVGQFIWTGFDYIGESTPYETKNSYFGQIDTAGFPKDSFYIFQSEWTDCGENPMVHIFPYWDFNEGQKIDVQICSNAPLVELLVNGKSLGTHAINHKSGRGLVGKWQVPYEKGEITAIAYDGQGCEIARKTRCSFEDTKELQMVVDKTVLKADGKDMVFVEISAFDAQGNPVENAKNRVFVQVKGAGRLLGLDNGNSADFDEYKGNSKRLFGGKLLAVIGSTEEEGEIEITLSSPGLADVRMELQAEKDGISGCRTQAEIDSVSGRKTQTKEKEVSGCEDDVQKYLLYGEGSKGGVLADGHCEIPIRKIELHAKGSLCLTEENPQVFIEAEIYPGNATYNDLQWRAVNDTGIDVNFVSLEPTEQGVWVTAKGDGSFRLRCVTRNGGSCVSVQSVLEMEAAGLGKAFLNPYEEVPAGLCEIRSEKATEGVEHGINFLGADGGKHEGIIGFTGIDFGPFGSDEIILPIFANTNDPITFQIWEGYPEEEGSVLLADCFYHKPPKWMVFQEQSYLLSKRLTGNAQLYIATDFGFQLRGIYFKEKQRAYAKLMAAECDTIYGDVYSKQDEAVEQIGNNVMLEFEDMDFGEEGSSRITICCRPHRELNPVQLRFVKENAKVETAGKEGIHGNEETVIQVVEAAFSEEYKEQTFEIETLKGKGKLQFVFMPGSCFDFHWFQFD